MDFRAILASAAPRDGGFCVSIPENWHQGRTAYGGLSAALALAAALRAGDYAENGCSSQVMDIWNADGVPVATGMQAIAVFG